MTIDGPFWFIVALIVCAAHAAFVLNRRRESRAREQRYREYNDDSQRRHDEFMDALTFYRRGKLGWSDKRGKA